MKLRLKKTTRSVKHALSSGRDGGAYFLSPSRDIDFIPSGCALLDCVLGGGWAGSRVINVIGDNSTGKTLLAIEAVANFKHKYRDQQHRVRYYEEEAAFDTGYAAALGVELTKKELIEDCETVEDLFDSLNKLADDLDKDEPCLAIVDSLDAVTDKAEQKRDISDGNYGTKAKQLGQLFRRLVRKMKKKNMTLFIISQTRDNIGVMFGEKYRVSGGKSLQFYSSQRLLLAQAGKTTRTIRGNTRVTSLKVVARTIKNKAGLPYRQCAFEIKLGFGIDDIGSGIRFLRESKQLKLFENGMSDKASNRYLERLDSLSNEGYELQRKAVAKAVRKGWRSIEEDFIPKRRKYA